VLTRGKGQGLRYPVPATIFRKRSPTLKYDKNGGRPARQRRLPRSNLRYRVVRGERAPTGQSLARRRWRSLKKSPSIIGDSPRQRVSHLFQGTGQRRQKRWNGEYFRTDHRKRNIARYPGRSTRGQWYATCHRLGDIVPRDMQVSSLKKIYAFNVPKFCRRFHGRPVNGSALTAPWSDK